MGLYTSSSPKKTAAGYGSQRWSEMRRKLVHRRYWCVWVLLALVPCYMLRQMFTSSPRMSEEQKIERPQEMVVVGKLESQKPIDEVEDVRSEMAVGVEESTKPVSTRATNVFRVEVKPEKKKTSSEHAKKNDTKKKEAMLRAMRKDDGDFGLPEDNEKEGEQSWQAPPSPIKKPTALEQSR